MPSALHLVLRSVPEAARAQVAGLLGRAFSLKEATCTAIAGSAPILLLPDLTHEEAVAVVFALGPMTRAGARLETLAAPPADLPKIDWPRRPQIFKRDIQELVQDLEIVVELGGQQAPLRDLIAPRLQAMGGASITTTAVQRSAPTPNQPFRGIQLPEITPFSNPVLPSAAAGSDDAVTRLNELFPDDGGFAPSSSDISSILDRILPEEGHPPAASGGASGSGRMAVPAPSGGGWSLFLPKFADDARRQKAVPLIAEHGRMSPEDADALSRKMIIPVLKGASQADAEAARQAFAKLGVVAKLKGPE
ncbi:MAG: hypothetical protein RLZZ127_411 [Planctomycetota bacterium]|jgi:hypothetical protein